MLVNDQPGWAEDFCEAMLRDEAVSRSMWAAKIPCRILSKGVY